MKIKMFIMRHGEAEVAKNFSQEADFSRPLTSFGEDSVREVGQRIFNRNIEITHAFVSPYVRTQQSFNLFFSTLPDKKLVAHTTTGLITPSGDGKEFHDFLDGLLCNMEEEKKQSNILIVSHAPFVSYLVESLTQGEVRPSFSPATVAEVSYDIKKMRGNLINITPAD